MDSPFSNFFSSSTKRFTPSQHRLQLLHLGAAESVPITDVEHSAFRRSVNPPSSSLLQTEAVHDFGELWVRGEERELDVDSGAHPGAEVGGTGEDVAQVLVVHVLLPALRLDGFLYETETLAPPLEHLHHVASLLHGDDAHVVLLVYPYKEVLLLVVPDAARVRPIPGHAGSQQERGDRLVEQEMVVDQLFLLLVSHVLERVVLACELTGQSRQSVLQNLLHGPALSAVACRWEPVPTDAPTGADAAAQDVLRVELSVAFDVWRGSGLSCASRPCCTLRVASR